MLVYNVDAMSSAAATPTRRMRGMPSLGIDTRSHADKVAASLSFSGWVTPPSAHESRRPSLANSALSDASHSGASSATGYSQPVTPVHSMSSQNGFTQQWSDGTDVHSSISANQVPQQSFDSAFQHLSMCNPNVSHELPFYASTVPDHIASFGVEACSNSPLRTPWPQPQAAQLDFSGRPALSTIFDNVQGLGQEDVVDVPMYNNRSQSMHTHLEPSVFPNYDATAPALSTANIYQPHQIVVPSQVSPQDHYSLEQYPEYDRPEAEEGFTQSFGSRNDWDFVGSQSPQDTYYDGVHAETVKREPASPSRPVGPVKTNVGRSKKGSKRSKKSDGNKCWQRLKRNGCDWSFEGPEFKILDVTQYGEITLDKGKQVQTKDKLCKYVYEDGKQCKASFRRPEHLNRHQIMHSDERKYPCPLPGCIKRVARSDNATDHLWTHIKSSKIRRNTLFPIEYVYDCLRAHPEWEPEKAEKIIKNLQNRWERHMPEAVGKQEEGRHFGVLPRSTNRRVRKHRAKL